ncbi:MAG: BPL-N domain-containing protein [Alphaproteobacteria bacterium]
MTKKILIYNDLGCEDVLIVQEEISNYFKKENVSVDFVDANQIINENALNSDVLAFIVPGGASSPYKQKLKTLGNEAIANYVKNGGSYLGICAGAYYPCKKIIFEKGIPELEKTAEHGLDLIDGEAIGTLHKEFNVSPYSGDYDSIAIANIIWQDDDKQELGIYYHGGPYFKLYNEENHDVLARYKDVEGNPPAIVSRNFGKGKVVVSGVHFELGARHLMASLSASKEPPEFAVELSSKLQEKENDRQVLTHKIMQKLIKAI